MSVSTEWVRGFVEEFVRNYVEAAFGQRIRKLEHQYAMTDTADGRYPRTRYNVGGEIVDTADGRCVVPETRILRWEKIERAAQQAIEGTDACGCRDIQVHSRELREALKP